MNHISYYLSGKAVKRELLTPNQLNVSEKISLGEDLCCVIPCYLQAKSVYISKKEAYLYTVRDNSLSKDFNSKQIYLIEDVINEISKNNFSKVADFREQLCRYSCFMCFTVLAAAAEGGHKESLSEIEKKILSSRHAGCIRDAVFGHITPKSRLAISMMKRENYRGAYLVLRFGKLLRNLLRR
jgi:hypothetical protein